MIGDESEDSVCDEVTNMAGNRVHYLVMAPRASNSTDVDWKFLWH